MINLSKNAKIISVIVVVGLLIIGGLYFYNEYQKPSNQIKRAVKNQVKDINKSVEEKVDDKMEENADEIEQKINDTGDKINQKIEGAQEDEAVNEQ